MSMAMAHPCLEELDTGSYGTGSNDLSCDLTEGHTGSHWDAGKRCAWLPADAPPEPQPSSERAGG